MSKNKITIIVIAAIIVILLFFAFMIFGTASGQRWLKSVESEYGGGLDRTITVYDYQGNTVKTYDGKIDIQYEDNRILFDDENGKRHQIIGGITIIDEK